MRSKKRSEPSGGLGALDSNSQHSPFVVQAIGRVSGNWAHSPKLPEELEVTHKGHWGTECIDRGSHMFLLHASRSSLLLQLLRFLAPIPWWHPFSPFLSGRLPTRQLPESCSFPRLGFELRTGIEVDDQRLFAKDSAELSKDAGHPVGARQDRNDHFCSKQGKVACGMCVCV